MGKTKKKEIDTPAVDWPKDKGPTRASGKVETNLTLCVKAMSQMNKRLLVS